MASPAPHSTGDFYEFGPFEIRIAERALYHSGELVPLYPKVFDTLLVLVEESGHVVSKTELLERIWPGTFVEEGSITQNISMLRKILAPHFPGESPIATIPRSGYRFTPSVRLRNKSAQVILAEPAAHTIAPVPPPAAARVRGGLWAIGAAVLLLAVVLVTLSFSTHAGAVLHRRSVAVLAMHDLSGQAQSAWISTALAETLSTELALHSGLRTVPGQTVAITQRDLGLPADAALTPKALQELRQNLSCDFMLAGSYLELNGKLRIDLKLIDTSSGETVALVSQTDDAQNLLDLVSRAGAELRSHLGLAPLHPSQTDLRATVSRNAEAQRLYYDGVAHLNQRDAAEAQRLLAKAVDADPTFPLARTQLASAWGQLGYDANAAAEAKRAMELANGLSREERLRVEARFHETAGEWAKAAETHRTLWRFFPDEIEYALALGSDEFHQNHAAEMLRITAQLKKLAPPMGKDPRIALQESTAHHLLSDYRQALSDAERAAQEAAQRKNLSVLATARSKQAINTDFLGDPDKARELYGESIRLYESLGDEGQTAYMLRQDAEILVRRGQVDAAEQEFAKALAITRRIHYDRMTTRVLFGYGSLERQRGKLASARKMIEEAMTINRQTGDESVRTKLLNNHGEVLRLEGDIAGARVDFQQSLDVARAANNRADISEALTNLAKLDVAIGNWKQARAELDEGIALKRQLGNDDALALSLPLFARVLVAEGDTAGAQKAMAEECTIHERHHQQRALAQCRLEAARWALAASSAAEVRAALDRLTADYNQIAASPVSLNLYAGLQLAAGDAYKAALAITAAERLLQTGSKIPERELPVRITAARIYAAQGRTAQAAHDLAMVRDEAARLHYGPLEAEAKQALAGIR